MKNLIFDLQLFAESANNAVCKIGENTYTDITDAVEEASSGDTITLLDNVAVEASVLINKTVTFDLNGFTLSEDEVQTGGGFYISSSGNLTINGEGTVSCKDYAVYNYGTVTINGGNFIGEVVNDGGTLTITGGTFSNDVSAYLAEGYSLANADGVFTVINDTALNITNDDNDTLIAGTSLNDTVINNGSNVTINAGAGDDTVINSGANVTINAGEGDDFIELKNKSAAVIEAGVGNDTVNNYSSDVTLQGGFTSADSSGNDVILTADNGSLTVTDGVGKTLNIDGVESVIGGESESTPLAAYIADYMLHKTEEGYPAFVNVAFHPNEETTDVTAEAYYSSETWTVTSADDLQLYGVHYSPESPKGKWVVLVAGYGKTGADMNPFASIYLAMGFDVLVIDPRASGSSEGEWLTMGVAEAVDLAVWSQKIAQTNSNAQIILHGISMGAATVILGAALSQSTNISAIIEDCGYSNIADVFMNLIDNYGSTFGFSGDSAALFEEVAVAAESLSGYNIASSIPLNAISNVTVPSVFIHGTNDTLIPADNADSLYEASGADNKTLLKVEGAEHAQSALISPLEYLAAISNLINSATSDIGGNFYSSLDNTLVRGTVYDDTITASGNNVSIDALGGNDSVTYSESADILFQFNNYSVEGSNVILTDGSDSLTVIDAKDKVLTLNGVQSVIGGSMSPAYIDNYESNILLEGTILNDTINSSADNVTVNSKSGDDSISLADSHHSSVFADEGNDSISVLDSDYVYINSGNGNDSVVVSKGSNLSVSTGNGDDSIFAGSALSLSFDSGDGNDLISSYFSDYSSLFAGSGNDSVFYSGSFSTINAGSGNDYIEFRAAFGDYNSAVLQAGSGDDSLVGYSEGVSISGNFIHSGFSYNDVLLISENGSLKIADAKGKSLIINGLPFSPDNFNILVSNGIIFSFDDDTELLFDSSGNVTGIAKGFATAKLLNSVNSPIINIVADSSFYFSASALDGSIKMRTGNNSIIYTSGSTTYSAGGCYWAEGTIGVKFSNDIASALLGNLTVNIPSGGINLNYGDEITLSLADTVDISTAVGTISLKGDITYNTADTALKLANGAEFNLNLTIGDVNINADITALEESILAVEGLNLVIKDGSAIHCSGNGSLGIIGDYSISGGDLKIGLLGALAGGVATLELDSGATLTFKSENSDIPISITSFDDLPLTINSENGINEYTTNDEKGMDLVIGGDSFNIAGTLKFSQENNTFTISEGTKLKMTQGEIPVTFTAVSDTNIKYFPISNTDIIYFEFENKDRNGFALELGGYTWELNVVGAISYSAGQDTYALTDDYESFIEITLGDLTYKITAEAGAIEVGFNEDGTITVNYPNVNTLSISRGGLSSSFEVAINGSINFGLAGSLSITEIVVNSGGVPIKITGNKEDTLSLTEEGIIITPAAPDNFKLEIINSALTFSEIEGTVTINGGKVILADGVKLSGTFSETSFIHEVAGGTVSIGFNGEELTYELNAGASFNLNRETLVKGGSFKMHLGDSCLFIAEGTEINSADLTVIIEKAGTFTLNGISLTATEDNVAVKLTDFNSVKFEADSAITYAEHIFKGEGTVEIKDGFISVTMTKAGTFELDGKTFYLTEEAEDGVTITLTEEGFTVSNALTEAETSDESAVGKTFVAINDEDYTVSLYSPGIKSINGVSDGTNITCSVGYEGDPTEYGSWFYVETDSNGTFTFDGKSYTISEDENVSLRVQFSNDGIASLVAVEDLNTGYIKGDLTDMYEVNGESFSISSGADNAQINNLEGTFIEITDLEEGAAVTLASDNLAVSEINTVKVNNVTYKVNGDSDGILIANGEVVYGLDENASLKVSESGTYTVNSTPLEVTENDVIIGLNDSYAYIYKENQINENQTTSEIIEAIGVEESEAVVITGEATDAQKVTLNNAKGEAAVIEQTETPVTITGGVGNDTVINRGDNTAFDMGRGGEDKVLALGGNVKLENYNPANNSGIQLTVEDMKEGVKFGEGTVELANGTVELENNFVNLYDVGGNKELVAFATNESKNIDAGTLTEGISIIGGGESLKEEVEKATLKGGSGNDSIIGGKSASIAAGKGNDYIEVAENGGSTITYGGGNDTIEGFNFTDEEGADVLKNVIIESTEVENGNVILKTDKGTITINDAENKNIALNNGILQVGENLIFDGVTDEYWAAGENASVTVAEDYDEEFTAINIKEINGDIKAVDASAFEGEAEITGNSADNVIVASEGGSTIDGGKGNDSMVGGAGADEFISTSGDDTISNFEFGTGETSDKLGTQGKEIDKVKVKGEDVIIVTESGSTQIEKAAAQTMQFYNNYTEGNIISAQFDSGTILVNEEANFYWAAGNSATVEVGAGLDTSTTLALDLSNSDFTNSDQMSFYGDIKEIDASTFEGTASLKGNAKNNIIIASEGGSTLNGGTRNDKLIGGAGADTFVYELGNGKDTISNFTFGTGENADMIDLSSVSINKVKVYGNDVVLEVDGGSVKVEGAAGKTVQLQSEHTNNKVVTAQFGTISVNEEANFYWAAGEKATISLVNYGADEAVIDLSNADYNNSDQMSFYGDIKEVDASGYEGYATITGNDKNNVLIGCLDTSTLWGGNGGNDTLIGGEGRNIFIYEQGNGNDVIQNAGEFDSVYLRGMTLDDIIKIETTDSSLKLKFKDGGNLSIETKELPYFSFDDKSAYSYDKDTKQFERMEPDAGGGGNY